MSMPRLHVGCNNFLSSRREKVQQLNLMEDMEWSMMNMRFFFNAKQHQSVIGNHKKKLTCSEHQGSINQSFISTVGTLKRTIIHNLQ